MAWIVLAFVAGCAIAGAGPTAKTARAQALEQPQGHVILTIRGSITRTNAHGAARFDRAMLQAMPQTVVETMTPWTDGITRFKGPLARDVMSRVGATGRAVKATAINDYAVEIPLSDFEAYPVILATQMNGEVLRTRTKGPVWVIYPWSDHADLRTEVIYGRSIWQLKEMVVVE